MACGTPVHCTLYIVVISDLESLATHQPLGKVIKLVYSGVSSMELRELEQPLSPHLAT